METGPLARLVIAYAGGNARVKELVDSSLRKLNLPLTALFSTLGRTAARGLEGLWAAEQLKEQVAYLLTTIKSGNEATANNDKWSPSTWPATAKGVGFAEAPRGALGHWIRIQDQKIENYQCVVPTTWNASPRDAQGNIGAYEAALLGVPMADPKTIYGPGVRLWHWANAFLMVVLCVTGYFIGVPPPSALGDPSSLYIMGWIRFLHLAAGYLFALLAIARLWLTFVEKGISHHLFVPAIWRREWFDGFMKQIWWNLLMNDKPTRYVGLNPLGNIAMLFMYVLPGLLIIITGFAMYAEVAGHDSWQYLLFGWVTAIFGNTMDLHTIHRLAMWVMVGFSFIHIYIAVREDVLSRQTMISSMLSGERQFRR